MLDTATLGDPEQSPQPISDTHVNQPKPRRHKLMFVIVVGCVLIMLSMFGGLGIYYSSINFESDDATDQQIELKDDYFEQNSDQVASRLTLGQQVYLLVKTQPKSQVQIISLDLATQQVNPLTVIDDPSTDPGSFKQNLIETMQVSRSGSVVYSSGDFLYIWDGTSPRLLTKLPSSQSGFSSQYGISPDGNRVFLLSSEVLGDDVRQRLNWSDGDEWRMLTKNSVSVLELNGSLEPKHVADKELLDTEYDSITTLKFSGFSASSGLPFFQEDQRGQLSRKAYDLYTPSTDLSRLEAAYSAVDRQQFSNRVFIDTDLSGEWVVTRNIDPACCRNLDVIPDEAYLLHRSGTTPTVIFNQQNIEQLPELQVDLDLTERALWVSQAIFSPNAELLALHVNSILRGSDNDQAYQEVYDDITLVVDRSGQLLTTYLGHAPVGWQSNNQVVLARLQPSVSDVNILVYNLDNYEKTYNGVVVADVVTGVVKVIHEAEFQMAAWVEPVAVPTVSIPQVVE